MPKTMAQEIAELTPDKLAHPDAEEAPPEPPVPKPQGEEPPEPEPELQAPPEGEEGEPQAPAEGEAEPELPAEEPDEFEQLRSQNDELREALKEVIARMNQVAPGVQEPPPQEPPAQPEPETRRQTPATQRAQAPWEVPVQMELPEFVDEQDFDTIITDRGLMNRKMADWANRVVQAARQAATVGSVQTFVPFISNQVQYAMLLQNYLADRPHLRQVLPQFQTSIQQVEREHGDWDYETRIFPEAENRLANDWKKVLKVLQSPPPARRKPAAEPTPAFVRPRGGSRVTPKPKTQRQSLTEDIMDLTPQRLRR